MLENSSTYLQGQETRLLYSPACDDAIGPYSFSGGNIAELSAGLLGLGEIARLVEELQNNSLGDGYNRVLNLNRNPGCLLSLKLKLNSKEETCSGFYNVLFFLIG